MAQTTAAISMKDCAVFLSTDGSTWTNEVSGYGTEIQVSGGERATGSAATFDGDTMILTAGKRGIITVTATFIYTETASQPYALARDAYEDGSALYIRWSPKGDDGSELRYTTSAGIVKQPVYPSGSASSADPVTVTVVLECASVTEATA